MSYRSYSSGSMSRETVTEGERRNGWDEARLKAYLAERDAAVNGAHRLGPLGQQAPRRVVVEGNGSFDPHEVVSK